MAQKVAVLGGGWILAKQATHMVGRGYGRWLDDGRLEIIMEPTPLDLDAQLASLAAPPPPPLVVKPLPEIHRDEHWISLRPVPCLIGNRGDDAS